MRIDGVQGVFLGADFITITKVLGESCSASVNERECVRVRVCLRVRVYEYVQQRCEAQRGTSMPATPFNSCPNHLVHS